MASPSPRREWWELREVDGAVVMSLEKFVDEQSIQVIVEELSRIANEGRYRNILLDFSHVEFVSSSALAPLLRFNLMLQGISGRLSIISVHPAIMDVFKITKCDHDLQFFPTEADALAGIRLESDEKTSQPLSKPINISPLREDVLTAEEIRQIEDDGITLDDAIQKIETSWE